MCLAPLGFKMRGRHASVAADESMRTVILAFVLSFWPGRAPAASDDPTPDDPAPSGDAGEGSEDRPVVLVIELGRRGRGEARTARFIGELGLVLDGFDVRGVNAPTDDFVVMPLANQLRDVRPMIENEDAVAAAWIAAPAPGILMLHMVALRTGQTLVRSLEAESIPGTEADLALAVRELLGAAWLFVPPALQDDRPAMRRLVESVRERVVSYGRGNQAGAEIVAVIGSVTIKDGLVDFEGASSEVAVGMAGEAELAEGFWAGGGVVVSMRPARSKGDTKVGGWGFSPHIDIAATVMDVDFFTGRLAFGPSVGFAFERERVTVQIGSAPEKDNTSSRLRAWAGLSLRWHINRRIGVIFDPRIGWASHQDIYRRESDNSIILTTPRVDWGFRLGVLYRPWAH